MKVRLDVAPLAGTLPLPVHPVVMYLAPVPALTGEVTWDVMEDPESNQPLFGVGVS